MSDRIEIIEGEPGPVEWQQLLDGSSRASIYHSPAFHRALRVAEIPLHLFQARRGGVLCGLAVIIEDRLLPLPLLGSKGFCPADLLAEDAEVERTLLRAIDRRLGPRMLYLELFHPEKESRFCTDGFRIDGHRNYILHLEQGYEALHQRYSRSMRRNLRKADESGLRLRRLRNEGELERVHELLSATARRVGAPALPRVLLKAVARELMPLDMARIYLAESPEGDRVINVRIELIYKGYAIDWYTGDDPERRESQAGPWLVDRILRELCAMGCHTFDFGGAGREGQVYGPAEFKRRFGGEQIRVLRRMRIWHPFLLAIARRGYRLLEGLSRR